MTSQSPRQAKPKQDPRKTPQDDPETLLRELKKLGPRKEPKRVGGASAK